MKLRFPMPPPDASYPRRLAQLVGLPMLVGVTIGLVPWFLFGPPALVVLVVLALVWTTRELRWVNQQKRELEVEMARWETLRLEIEKKLEAGDGGS